jgi:hypothetical protein
VSIEVSIDANLTKLVAFASQLDRQLPFAASVALNRTAYQVQQQANYETGRYFNKDGPPNAFTRRAFRFERSTKANLTAVVGAAPIQSRYLRFGIQGGFRPAKGFERKFLSDITKTRQVPAGTQLVPTSKVRRTSSGSVSLATIRTISRGLNSTRGGFFYGVPRGGGKNVGRPLGIYRRSREQLFPYFVALPSRARYDAVFPLQDIAAAKVRQVFPSLLSAALDQALATAR